MGRGASPALDRAYSARVSELTRTRIHRCSQFFFPFSTCWYGFEFKGSRAMKPRGPRKQSLAVVTAEAAQTSNFYVHHSTDPQSDVARALGWAPFYGRGRRQEKKKRKI